MLPVSPGVDEPPVPARGVIRHEIDEHPQAEGVGLAHQVVELRERPEPRVHVAVLGHVVAVVELGAGIERGDPEGVDTEAVEVRQPRPETGKVADAVAVGEAMQVDLVDDGVPPPGRTSVVAPHRAPRHRPRIGRAWAPGRRCSAPMGTDTAPRSPVCSLESALSAGLRSCRLGSALHPRRPPGATPRTGSRPPPRGYASSSSDMASIAALPCVRVAPTGGGAFLLVGRHWELVGNTCFDPAELLRQAREGTPPSARARRSRVSTTFIAAWSTPPVE